MPYALILVVGMVMAQDPPIFQEWQPVCPPGFEVIGCQPCPEGTVSISCDSNCVACPVIDGIKTLPNADRTRCVRPENDTLTSGCRGSLSLVETTLDDNNTTVSTEQTYEWKVYLQTYISFFKVRSRTLLRYCTLTFNTGKGPTEARVVSKRVNLRQVKTDYVSEFEPIVDITSEFEDILLRHNQDLRLSVICDIIGVIDTQVSIPVRCGDGSNAICRNYASPMKLGIIGGPFDITAEITFKYWQEVTSHYEANPKICKMNNYQVACP
jgi:hypothetical protein